MVFSINESNDVIVLEISDSKEKRYLFNRYHNLILEC